MEDEAVVPEGAQVTELAVLRESLKTMEERLQHYCLKSIIGFTTIAVGLASVLIGTGGYSYIKEKALEVADNELNQKYVVAADSLVGLARAHMLETLEASQRTAQFRIASGTTAPGGTPWRSAGKRGLSVEVDTRSANLTETPLYLCSIYGRSEHWIAVGANSIYDATPSGFRINLFDVRGDSLSVEQAREDLGWYVRWVAITPDGGSTP